MWSGFCEWRGTQKSKQAEGSWRQSSEEAAVTEELARSQAAGGRKESAGRGTGWTLSEARLLGREAVSLRAQHQKKACFCDFFCLHDVLGILFRKLYLK